MKCIVVYFSQTGNTEKIANAIQKGVKEAAGNCDMVKIKDADPKNLFQYDLIGLGSPIFHTEPDNVGDFVNNLWSVGGKHTFVFSTHGTIPEYFLPNILPKLRKKGVLVIGWEDWYADCYIPWHPEPYPTTGHPDAVDLREAEQFGKEIVQRSVKITSGVKGLIPSEPQTPPPLPSQKSLGIKDTVDDPSIFKYHKELCRYPKCRLCMDNCPKYSIDLSTNPPVIASCCQPHCTFCTLICPTGAIEIDDFINEQVPHYRHTTETIALPRLIDAEASGKFRRLLPVDKIGWKTYFYQVHNKHPKWIIGKGAYQDKRKDR